jgi:GMP reductase
MPKIEEGLKLDFNNVLIRPKRSTINSRSDVNLMRTIKFKNCKSLKSWEGIPIIASNMDTVGTFEVYKTLSKFKIITALHKFYNAQDFIVFQSENNVILNPNLFMVSTGIQDTDFYRLKEILSVIECNWICIDIANGYIESLVNFCKRVRKEYPDKIIVAGNVVTREIVEELILNGGVDVVKVGIGPGSACLTRMKTGVGMPQLSAIMECADAAHGVGGHIIGDGGITCPGDMAKAFGGGADFVMVGGAFSGHDENPGEIIMNPDGSQSKLFYGMSSSYAMIKHYGGMNEYRASEGRTIRVPYRGPLTNTVLDYLGGLRSTCTYINASCIKHMSLCTTFVQVSQQLNTSLV